jgi:hypothetical protein
MQVAPRSGPQVGRTRRPWADRLVSATAAFSLIIAIGGCGGGSSNGSSGNAQLRVLNLTSDVSSVDVMMDDSKIVSAAMVDTLGAYVEFSADTYDVDVLRSGASSSLNNSSRSFSKDQHYTAVVWGRESALKLATLPEDEDEDDISAGKAKLRVFSATSEVGALDVYLTRNDTALENTTPVVSGLAASGLSGYSSLDAGSWRLRITGAGDSSDLRLDVPAVLLADKKYNSLLLTAGAGGVLVHASLLVQQQAGLTSARNTKARLRVVAGVESNGSVGVAWNGVTQAGGLRSPSVAPYALVDAGDRTLELRVNGTIASSGSASLTAGADYSVLAWGPAAAARLTLISDDNRLPTANTRAKLRLVHAASLADALTLSLDYAALVSDLAVGSASTFATPTAKTGARIDVSAASAADALFTASDVDLQGMGVYTVFVLGGHASPTGVLRKDR